MIGGVKRDLILMGKGMAMVLPFLVLAGVVLDIKATEPLGYAVVIVLTLVGGIPIIRDEIQQAKQRERDGLRH